MFNQITDSSDDKINTDDVSYSVSSNSTNPNVNIVNIKTGHEKEDEVGCSADKEEQWDTANATLNILLKNVERI